ncbi:MAG: hypothetical protein RL007_717 [Bacteroidota bacterium]|jgi:hypothetical protein
MRRSALQRVLDFYVFSNLHIALCAVAACIASYMVLGIRFNTDVLMVAGSGTLSLYCWQRWLGVKQKENPDYPAERHQWNYRNNSLLLVLTILGAVVAAACLYALPAVTWKIVGVAGAVAIVYSAPMIPFNGKLIRLRDVTGVKVFVIALTWTLVCVWIPFSLVLKSDSSSMAWELNSQAFVWKWSLIFFLAAVALTLPFDVRDMDFDKGVLRSLPMIFGARRMTAAAALIVLISGILFWYFESRISGTAWPSGIWRGYFLWSTIAFAVVLKSNNRSEHYYSFLIDGLLLLLPLALLIS